MFLFCRDVACDTRVKCKMRTRARVLEETWFAQVDYGVTSRRWPQWFPAKTFTHLSVNIMVDIKLVSQYSRLMNLPVISSAIYFVNQIIGSNSLYLQFKSPDLLFKHNFAVDFTAIQQWNQLKSGPDHVCINYTLHHELTSRLTRRRQQEPWDLQFLTLIPQLKSHPFIHFLLSIIIFTFATRVRRWRTS